jgi:hypothetical protein
MAQGIERGLWLFQFVFSFICQLGVNFGAGYHDGSYFFLF